MKSRFHSSQWDFNLLIKTLLEFDHQARIID